MSCQKIFSVLVIACCLATTAPLQAVPITSPTGLAPGEHYRLAFVTSTTRDAASTDITDYNAFVTAVANTEPVLLALGTTWTAIASTAAVAALANTATDPSPPGPTGIKIFRLNDTKLADDYDDLWDGTIDVPLSYDEHGLNVGPTFVWTGTNPDGSGDVPDPLGTPTPALGFTDTSDLEWIRAGTGLPSGLALPLYAISGDLTVPGASPAAIPEPSTWLLFATGCAGLLGYGWRRRQWAA